MDESPRAAAAGQPESGKAPSWRRWVGMAVGIGVVVATFVFVLPKIADYRDVWDAVKTLDWTQLAALFVATLINLATYAPPWQAALPGLHFRQAFVVTQASTASTYIAPGGAAVGMALSYGMLRGWGFAGLERRARRCGHGRVEPVRAARLPRDRAGAPHHGERDAPAARDRLVDRARDPRHRRGRLRARALDREDRRLGRQLRRARHGPPARLDPPRAGEMGRRVVRALPRPDRRAPAPALARAHAGDARRAPLRVPALRRLPAHARCQRRTR